jgi:hypothetical protein
VYRAQTKKEKNDRNEGRKKNVLLLKMKKAHPFEKLGTQRHSLLPIIL